MRNIHWSEAHWKRPQLHVRSEVQKIPSIESFLFLSYGKTHWKCSKAYIGLQCYYIGFIIYFPEVQITWQCDITVNEAETQIQLWVGAGLLNHSLYSSCGPALGDTWAICELPEKVAKLSNSAICHVNSLLRALCWLRLMIFSAACSVSNNTPAPKASKSRCVVFMYFIMVDQMLSRRADHGWFQSNASTRVV